MSAYEVLKDFAGPFATIVASITAATVTSIFAVKQWKTSSDQAQIALDKIKIDVLKDRMAVVTAVRTLAKLALNVKPGSVPDFEQMQALQRTIDDGRFLFSADTREYLRIITNQCHDAVQFPSSAPGSRMTALDREEIIKKSEARKFVVRELQVVPVKLQDEISPTFLIRNFHLRTEPKVVDWGSPEGMLKISLYGIALLAGVILLLCAFAVGGSRS